MTHTHKLIIVGSGPAGLTAAIYAARAHLEPIVIEGATPGGQLVGTSYVENWPGEKHILGAMLMQNMREHAASLGVQFIEGQITQLNANKNPFALTTSLNTTLYAHALILAMGAEPKRLKCPGEDIYWGKGVSTCAVCDGTFYKNKTVVIVGGGDTAMESASFLRKFTDKITLVHILDKLTASSAMQERVIHDPAISIIYESTVTSITGDSSTVTGVTIKHQKTGTETSLKTDGVFIAIGLTPNTGFITEPLKRDKWGYLTVSDNTKTSVPGIFAAGDVQDFRYRQAITAAGSGCMAALDAERYLSGLEKG